MIFFFFYLTCRSERLFHCYYYQQLIHYTITQNSTNINTSIILTSPLHSSHNYLYNIYYTRNLYLFLIYIKHTVHTRTRIPPTGSTLSLRRAFLQRVTPFVFLSLSDGLKLGRCRCSRMSRCSTSCSYIDQGATRSSTSTSTTRSTGTAWRSN